MVRPVKFKHMKYICFLGMITFAVHAVVGPVHAGDPCRLEAEKAVLEPFEKDGKFGYQLSGGMVIIEPRFEHAIEFSARGIAAVVDAEGWAYIDRTGAVRVRPHVVDNGPDAFSEGLARFVEDGKLGFIDEQARIVISADFAYAEPFKDGYALVCQDCRPVSDGEHTRMVGAQWGAIDKAGRIAVPPEHARDIAMSAVRLLKQ